MLYFASYQLQAADFIPRAPCLARVLRIRHLWRVDCLYERRRVARKRTRHETTALAARWCMTVLMVLLIFVTFFLIYHFHSRKHVVLQPALKPTKREAPV